MPGSRTKPLGQTLREAREQKGVTLAEAQQATKIRQAFLQALEQENYGVLPPPVYIRGFLKNYATFLGLDPAEMVLAFDELMEAVAMGINPYAGSTDSGSADSGSADSGGKTIIVTAAADSSSAPIESVSHVEALEETAEILKVEDKPAVEAESVKEVVETPVEKPVINSQPKSLPPVTTQAIVPVSRTESLRALRVPEKYTLRPAIQPLNKPPIYIPNFMPALAVLIIVVAAMLLVYQGVGVQRTTETIRATPTPNVFSAPTVTPLSGNPLRQVTSASTAVPNTVAPNPTMLANIAAGSVSQTNTPVVATATAAPTPAPVQNPVKMDIVVNDAGSWVQVWVDDKPALNEMVKSKTLSFTGNQKVEIALGKPASVKILVNGQEKQYAPPNSGTVIKVFRADGTEAVLGR